MKYASLLVATITLCTFLISCSKNKTEPANNNGGNNNTVTLTDEEKFLVGTWVFEKAVDTFRPKNDYNNPQVTEGIIPCRMDDVYYLKADKTYTKDEGADTCNEHYTYEPKEWGLQYGNMIFKDGPNTMWPNGYTKVDDNRFSLRWSDGGNWDGTTIITFYFKRK